jgi:hypothetical protein
MSFAFPEAPTSLPSAPRAFYAVTTLRGETAISLAHFNVDERGGRQLLGQTGFLVPARLLFWRPKRAQTKRISWR